MRAVEEEQKDLSPGQRLHLRAVCARVARALEKGLGARCPPKCRRLVTPTGLRTMGHLPIFIRFNVEFPSHVRYVQLQFRSG
jgi:hypothetical protein